MFVNMSIVLTRLHVFVVFSFNVITNLKPYVSSLLYNILWEISSFSLTFEGSVNIVTTVGNISCFKSIVFA